jgi:hypothetical protein
MLRTPYTFVMANEDTVLEEAMDNLKEAGQRIRATQSLMRSQGINPMNDWQDEGVEGILEIREGSARVA